MSSAEKAFFFGIYLIFGGIVLCLVDDRLTSIVVDKLGQPKRYVFSEVPFRGYVISEDSYNLTNAHCVDFEIACDLYDISDAKTEHGIYNPHVVNILEPDLDGDEIDAYLSHSVILDDDLWNVLLSYSNCDGNSRKYVGVVEGYSIGDLRKLMNYDGLDTTGLCFAPFLLDRGGMRRPSIPFNETKHKRFVQASKAYHEKCLKRAKYELSCPRKGSFYYVPTIYKFNMEC